MTKEKPPSSSEPSGSAVSDSQIEELFQAALQLHQAGNLAQAEALYRKILETSPDHADANHLLGVTAYQASDNETAVELISKAIGENPAVAGYHSNLGNAFYGLGLVEEAVASYSEAQRINPDYVQAHINLGNLFREQDRGGEAIGSYRQALTIQPDLAEVHRRLGALLQEQGLWDDTIASYRESLRLEPDVAWVLSNLATAFLELGQLDDAVDSYRKGLALEPNSPQIHYNLGIALQMQGLLEDAAGVYEQALRLDPEYAEAYGNLGNVLADLNRIDEAVDSYRQALRFNPDYAEAHANLGNALNKKGMMDEAIEHHREALRINPQFVEAYTNLGVALNKLGRIDDAITSLRQALEIDPSFVDTHSALIFLQDFCSDIDTIEQQAERKRWNERFMSPLAAKIKPHTNSRDPDRRLRVGYVSADFKEHSACLAFASLILDHDRDQFDVFCYAGNTFVDFMTERLRSAATGWRSSTGLSDDALADCIREDGIDILVDLSGHTKGNRLLVFGQKPAPLQVTGIGHSPSGSPIIDYRLTTALLTSPAEEYLYPEKAVYLNVFMGFLPPQKSPPVGAGPGIEGGDFIFGSFNRIEKISDEALRLWAGILRDVPKSKLLMKCSGLEVAATRNHYKDVFSKLGIPPERLILLGRTSHREHLEAHDRVHISLDTFPHGGGVTTLESLWMGVPVLGLFDNSKAANRSIKVLCDPLGLGEWSKESLEDYHRAAVDWAGKRKALAALRPRLRDRVKDVYFCFPHEVEQSYRTMWTRWCAGEAPTPIDVANGG